MGEGHLKEGRNKVCPHMCLVTCERGHKCLERKAPQKAHLREET